MKRITATLISDEAAQAWLDLLKISDVTDLKVESIDETLVAATPPSRANGHVEFPVIRKRAATPVHQALASHFGVLKHFPLSEAIRFATSLGFAETTASPALSTLKSLGYVGRRDSDGFWYFLKPLPANFKLTRPNQPKMES